MRGSMRSRDAQHVAHLTIRTGAQPANCAAAAAGTVLATINLPADWLAAATGGIKCILAVRGRTVVPTPPARGALPHPRTPLERCVKCRASSARARAIMQLDNTTIVAGQTVSITAFTLTDGNA